MKTIKRIMLMCCLGLAIGLTAFAFADDQPKKKDEPAKKEGKKDEVKKPEEKKDGIKKDEGKKEEGKKEDGKKADVKKEEKKAEVKPFALKDLEGNWVLQAGMKAGEKVPGDLAKYEFTFKDDTMTMKLPDIAEKFTMKLKVDPKKTPIEVDIEITNGPLGKGSLAKGIIELKDDICKICYEKNNGPDRPTTFAGDKYFLFELKKKK